ncbi:MAG: SRPBCC family protein [Cyclobacteriaceae bacterium]
MIKTILVALGFLIALILLIALVMKKSYSITSEVIVNRPKKAVFDYIKHIKNQEKYSKWMLADPNIEIEYKGIDGTLGFVSAWQSAVKNVGVGEQEITFIQEGNRYDVEIRFKKPFEGVSQATNTVEAVGDQQTKVITTFHSKTPFPMSIMIPMIKKMLKKDMDENGTNLKRILEQQLAQENYFFPS